MEFIPAIDLRAGAAVRLLQGDYAQSTSYGDPFALADAIAQGGATRLHVVDLDGALSGESPNRAVIATLAGSFSLKVQTGGGVRQGADIEALLGAGCDRVILGTTVIETPEVAAPLLSAYRGKVLLGLDFLVHEDRTIELRSRGWTKPSAMNLFELFDAVGVDNAAGIVATSIATDGTLLGPDLEALNEMLGVAPVPVIASGGVGTLSDLDALGALRGPKGERLDGVICGKAIVENRFTVAEGVARCALSG